MILLGRLPDQHSNNHARRAGRLNRPLEETCA